MLEEKFGFSFGKEYEFFENNKGKVYLINKDVRKLDFNSLKIDSIGLYIGRMQKDGFRPSIEGSQLLGKKAKKNVFELTLEQRYEWMTGKDLEVEGEEDRIVLVKYKEDFLGAGKIRGGELLNSVPKARRLRVVND